MIRRARREEAPALTALALASKAHWGYDAAFMARAAPELTIRPEQVAADPFFVWDDGALLGFYGLAGRPPALVLEYLFVTPERIGTGLGGRLWEHAAAEARRRGARWLELEAEPNAEGFYRSRGAERVGASRSPSTGRELPLMRRDLLRPRAF